MKGRALKAVILLGAGSALAVLVLGVLQAYQRPDHLLPWLMLLQLCGGVR